MKGITGSLQKKCTYTRYFKKKSSKKITGNFKLTLDTPGMIYKE